VEFSYYHARLGLETSSVRKQDLQPHVRADDRGSALRRVDQRLKTLNRFHGHDNGDGWTEWRSASVLADRQTDRQTDRPIDTLSLQQLAHSVTDSQTDMFIAIRRFHGHDNGECWTAWRYADVLSDRQTDRQTDRPTHCHCNN